MLSRPHLSNAPVQPSRQHMRQPDTTRKYAVYGKQELVDRYFPPVPDDEVARQAKGGE